MGAEAWREVRRDKQGAQDRGRYEEADEEQEGGKVKGGGTEAPSRQRHDDRFSSGSTQSDLIWAIRRGPGRYCKTKHRLVSKILVENFCFGWERKLVMWETLNAVDIQLSGCPKKSQWPNMEYQIVTNQLVGWLADLLACWLACWLSVAGWLAGWPAGCWLAGWLAGFLAGCWLAGWLSGVVLLKCVWGFFLCFCVFSDFGWP